MREFDTRTLPVLRSAQKQHKFTTEKSQRPLDGIPEGPIRLRRELIESTRSQVVDLPRTPDSGVSF